MLDVMGSSATADVEATFNNISRLYDAHHQFVSDLDKTVSDWSPDTCVGSHLKTLVGVTISDVTISDVTISDVTIYY